MNITISEGVLVTVVGGFLGLSGRAILRVAGAVIDSLKSSDLARVEMVKVQGEILNKFQAMLDNLGTQKALDSLRRVIARSNPSAFLCDGCHGWEGPPEMKPETCKRCTCSDPAPKKE